MKGIATRLTVSIGIGAILFSVFLLYQTCPMSRITGGLWSESFDEFLLSGLGLAVFILAIGLSLKFLVVSRLSRINGHLKEAVRQHDYAQLQPIELGGSDEISDLASSFNVLSDELRKRYASLESDVEARTRELELTNERLQHAYPTRFWPMRPRSIRY